MKFVGVLLILMGILVGYELAYKGESVAEMLNGLTSFLGLGAPFSSSSSSTTTTTNPSPSNTPGSTSSSAGSANPAYTGPVDGNQGPGVLAR